MRGPVGVALVLVAHHIHPLILILSILILLRRIHRRHVLKAADVRQSDLVVELEVAVSVSWSVAVTSSDTDRRRGNAVICICSYIFS